MRVTYIFFEGTPEEFAETPLATLAQTAAMDPDLVQTLPASTVARAPEATSPDKDDAFVHGVPADGQDAVQRQLRRNPAADFVRGFITVASAWRDVRVHGKKRRGAHATDSHDFTDYLRIRRTGSPVGGFAYIWPDSGVVLLRLPRLDDQSRDIAPDAVETTAGHLKYRVKITIVDDNTRAQAIALALLAYEAT